MMFLLPMIYVIVHQPSGDQWRTYDGMSEATVRALVQETGVPYDIVDENTFRDFVGKHKFTPATDQADPVKQQAIKDAKNSLLTPQQRMDALIKAINLQ